MAGIFETNSYNDGLGLTLEQKENKAEKWLSSGAPLTTKQQKKLDKWGLSPVSTTPIIRPAPATGVPTINLPNGGQAAPPLQAPTGAGESESGGSFDLGGMFSSLPSWAIYVGIGLGAYLLLKKR
jgi:hypothetical protein